MSTTMEPLLIELCTEELPPKALARLGEAFASGIAASLRADGMVADAAGAGGAVEAIAFATPRRLGVRIEGVLAQGATKAVRHKLMPCAIARDASGSATVALRKKLAALGREALADAPIGTVHDGASLVIESDGKADSLFLLGSEAGLDLAVALQRALDATLAKLPIPKVMTYQLADGETDVHFVRPAHRLVVLHGSEVVAVTALGLAAGRITLGHRVQGAKHIELDAAARYEELLRHYGKVEPVFARRRDQVRTQLEAQATALGAQLGAPESYAELLDEVTALVEWPTVYVCRFESEFLAVPQECLILTMKTNQKYFPLFDEGGKLKHQFLVVSNMELADPKKVIEGNERVVRPRLADARFFFDTDKKTRLGDRVPELASVVYHNKLGSQGERVERVTQLAGEVATLIGADRARAERAATLAKADLPTLMVGEFPELQGTMGRYYAQNDGEAPDVAAACAEHYRPRFAGDALPSAGVPTAVALADKLETLAGLFGIGQTPTGDKDPFALRRHALGVIRILVEGQLSAPLPALLDAAFECFGGRVADEREPLAAFIYERLRGFLKDTGASSQEIDAVVAPQPTLLAQVPAQLAAIRAFAALPEAASLNAANKRVANILKKAVDGGETIAASDAPTEAAERALRDALAAIRPAADAHFRRGDFTAYLKSFAALKAPVDAFFEQVMVMADDPAIRANRLALLRDLRDAMNKVADLSKLAA